MPASLKVDTRDIDRAMRGLSEKAKKQIPFATAVAITRTAKAVEKGLQKELGDTFDQPSRYITRGTFATKANKQTLSATVGMRDQSARGASPAQYVKESFGGGARGMKPYELAMQSMGALPAGYRAVPGAGIKLDKSGGPNRKALTEIFGALKRGARVYAGRGKNMRQEGYFVVSTTKTARTNALAPGLYRRTGAGRGSRIQAVFYFVREATYKKVIDLPAITKQGIDAVFSREFEAALAQALATAR